MLGRKTINDNRSNVYKECLTQTSKKNGNKVYRKQVHRETQEMEMAGKSLKAKQAVHHLFSEIFGIFFFHIIFYDLLELTKC